MVTGDYRETAMAIAREIGMLTAGGRLLTGAESATGAQRRAMSAAVLDASALLALLNAENGAEIVQEFLPESVISTVNLAEGVTCLAVVEFKLIH
jgi:magnesium-transporting ATPase (P-type)